MKLKIVNSLIVLTLGAFMSFGATAKTSVPSCYSSNKIEYKESTKVELFVFLDQTVKIDDKLKSSVYSNVSKFLTPENAVTIAQFSAFSEGRYLDVLYTGLIEDEPDDNFKNNESVKLVKKMDECLSKQKKYAVSWAKKSMDESFATSESGLGKSDILASLKALGDLVSKSKAERKVILLVSDMLENSSVTSFYTAKGIRKIEPEKEMRIIESEKLLSDFNGASVYIMGAGLINEEGALKGVYRDPKVMSKLKDFWIEYFSKSKGKVEEFGAPALLKNVN